MCSSGSVVVVVVVVVVWLLPGGRSQERGCHVFQYEAQWIIILPFPPEFDPGLGNFGGLLHLLLI